MNRPTHGASAHQSSGGPSPVSDRRGKWSDRAPNSELTEVEVEVEITELVNQSTHELRLAWRQLHYTGPPQGLSRDLLIRALANQLQERSQGGRSRALHRRLQTLATEFEKGGASC